MIPRVAGYCPMGCGETLFLGAGNRVTCSFIDCPDPGAVDEILGDAEVHHLVTFDEDGFTIRHPLRERLGDALMECELHNVCAHLDGPPVKLGRYRARLAEGRWSWERVW